MNFHVSMLRLSPIYVFISVYLSHILFFSTFTIFLISDSDFCWNLTNNVYLIPCSIISHKIDMIYFAGQR